MVFEGEKEPVYKLAVKYNGKEFESISELSRELNISRQAVSYALKNNKKVKGYKVENIN